jgi:hypothetical protein
VNRWAVRIATSYRAGCRGDASAVGGGLSCRIAVTEDRVPQREKSGEIFSEDEMIEILAGGDGRGGVLLSHTTAECLAIDARVFLHTHERGTSDRQRDLRRGPRAFDPQARDGNVTAACALERALRAQAADELDDELERLLEK